MEKNILAKILRYIGIALCLFGLFAGIYGLIVPTGRNNYIQTYLTDADSIEYFFLYFDVVTNMIVLLFGLIYLLLGGRKQDSKWYRLFMASFAIIIFCGFIASYFDNGSEVFMSAEYWIDHLLNIIAYTCCVILAVRQDLGKLKSFLLLGILTVIYIRFCASIPASLFQFSLFRVRLLMCPVGLLMAYNKYADKKARGSK